MATVNSKTSIKIDQLINDTVVDGEIVGSHLILRTRGGAEIDAGVVTGGTGSVSALDVMPVGYVYMSVDPTSPATLFGGSWSRIGQGRVLVGYDSTQSEFDTVEKTGGEKTHTITTGELPSHTHAIDHDHAAFDSDASGNHTHVLERKTATGTSTGVARGGATATADGTTAAAPDHVHSINVPALTGNSGSTGTGTAHNNLQPYLVVHMWKRVASAVGTQNGSATLSGQSSMVASGRRKARAIASFSSQSSMTVIGTIVSDGASASFSAQSSMTAIGKRKARAIAALSAQSSMTANGTKRYNGVVALSTQSSMTAVGTVSSTFTDAADQAENFESGTNGNAIGNTDLIFDTGGFTNGDFTCTFSSDYAVSGSLSMKQTLTTGNGARRADMVNGVATQVGVRTYIYRPTGASDPSTSTTLMYLQDGSTVTQASVRWISGGATIQMRDDTVNSGTGLTVPKGEWVRVEWFCDASASTQYLRLFYGSKLHSSVDDYSAGTSGSLDSDFSVQRVYWGSNVAPGVSFVVYYDDIGYREGDWVGPAF